MELDNLIRYYEAKHNRLERLVTVLQELVNNVEVTRKINDELEMQIGERDVCFNTLQYLKSLKND